jgi:uncharacterized protein (TIGR02722 family)
MRHTKIYKHISLALFAFSISSCTTFQGEYRDPTEVEILDTKWNETDARKTSEILITSMLKKPWLRRHYAEHSGAKPTIIVDGVVNRTEEHIDTKAMIEAIRNEMLNSGEVRFVNSEGRGAILEEITYQTQSGMVDPSKAKQAGKQLGAGYMLSGNLSSQVHRQGNTKSITYQTVLYLTNLETAELVWSEKYDIKKRFKNASASW